MGLLSLLFQLIRASCSYMELKAKRYEHDVREQSRNRLEALEDEITKLRNSSDPIAALTADRMLDRLLTEKAYFKSLPNSGASDQSWDGD